VWPNVFFFILSQSVFLLWNNKDILYKNKSLFFENWYRNNIVLVGQLYDTNGRLYSYSEILQKCQIPVSVKEYAIVFDAIPSGIRMLLGGINFPWPQH